MPRFFIHSRDRVGLIEDVEGSDWPDFNAARSEALASARELLAAQLKANQTDGVEQLEICDALGHMLATVPLRDILSSES
jgi:hypothetical protein